MRMSRCLRDFTGFGDHFRNDRCGNSGSRRGAHQLQQISSAQLEFPVVLSDQFLIRFNVVPVIARKPLIRHAVASPFTVSGGSVPR